MTFYKILLHLHFPNPTCHPLPTLSTHLFSTPFTPSWLALCGFYTRPGDAGSGNHGDIQKEGCWRCSEPPPPHPPGTQDIRVLQCSYCQVLVPYGQCWLQQTPPTFSDFSWHFQHSLCFFGSIKSWAYTSVVLPSHCNLGSSFTFLFFGFTLVVKVWEKKFRDQRTQHGKKKINKVWHTYNTGVKRQRFYTEHRESLKHCINLLK